MDSAAKKSRPRSRSRSKTPTEVENRATRSGRKTPIITSTNQSQVTNPLDAIEEHEEIFTSPPAHRTRSAMKTTSDYSSEEPDTSPERLTGYTRQQAQNTKTYSYEEHIYTTRSESVDSVQGTQDLTQIPRRLQVSPTRSDTSFSSTFAELTMADAAKIRDIDGSEDLLPYKLYKFAGEYWNKYPKTDYAYSPYSKDYVELAPGQVAMPNMSRRSLQNFRLYGTNESTSEEYVSGTSMAADSHLKQTWDDYDGLKRRIINTQSQARPNHNGLNYYNNYRSHANDHYWLTRILISIWTKIVTTITTETTTESRSDSYPYYYGTPVATSNGYGVSRIGRYLAAPFIYMASIVSRTCTVENVSTVSSTMAGVARKRKFWYFLIPLLLLLAWSRGDYQVSDVQYTKIEHIHNYIVGVIGSKPEIQSPAIANNPSFSKSDVLQWINAELEEKLLKLKAEVADGIETSEFNRREATRKMEESLRVELSAWRAEIINEVQHQITINKKETKEVTIINKHDEEGVRRIVAEILAIYDADKTGMVDYAMESAGGQVISIRCTESYQAKTAQISILGVPLWWLSSSPRVAITAATNNPGECWAFQGFPGYLVIRLHATINVTGFSLEHVSKLLVPDGKIESAPKNFTVWGLLSETDANPHKFGDYMYDENGTALQYFPVQMVNIINVSDVKYQSFYDIIELRIETNYGNPTYTCLYRFRVHGDKINKHTPINMGNR